VAHLGLSSGRASVRADRPSLPEPIDVYVRRGDAERALAVLLRDEPSWRRLLSIAAIELSAPVESGAGVVAG
jgi:hypothetical protein